MVKIKTYIIPLLQVMILAFLLWITVLPVEVRWSDDDGIMAYALPVIGVIGGLCVLFTKGGGKLTIVDGLVCVWALYYVGRVWFGAEYPCGTEWLQVMEMIVLYIVLRMMFHNTKIPAWVLCAGIVLFAFYEAIVGASQLILGRGRHHIFVLTGTFQNPGPYSAYLMMAGTLAIFHLQHIKCNLQTRFSRILSCAYNFSFANHLLRRLLEDERVNSFIKNIPHFSFLILVFCLCLFFLLRGVVRHSLGLAYVLCGYSRRDIGDSDGTYGEHW